MNKIELQRVSSEKRGKLVKNGVKLEIPEDLTIYKVKNLREAIEIAL